MQNVWWGKNIAKHGAFVMHASEKKNKGKLNEEREKKIKRC